MILGSYPDPANSTSKFSDLLPGRKCLPGQALLLVATSVVFSVIFYRCCWHFCFWCASYVTVLRQIASL